MTRALAILAALALSGCISGAISYPCVTTAGETCTVTIDRGTPAPVVVPAPDPPVVTPTEAPG